VNDPVEEAALKELLGSLIERGVQVTAVVGLPDYKVDIPTELAKSALTHGRLGYLPEVREALIREKSLLAVNILRSFEGRGVEVLDLLPLFHDESGITQFEDGGRSLYYDKSHLSIFGANRLKPVFEEVLGKLE
jgi:hypothetical protein